jgi:hypothetical protein
MLNVKVSTNSKQVSNYIKKYSSTVTKALDISIKQAGFQLVAIIKELTKKGVDFRRAKFAPYSEGYLKRLQKKGEPTKVDLFLTGEMLGSLTTKRTGKNKASVFFNRSSMTTRALFNQTMMGSSNREFFGFDKRTEKIIGNQFRKTMTKILQRV